MKYHTANLRKNQYDAAERVRDLLEISKQGPYGGHGGSVSLGQAIEYACKKILPELEQQVEQIQAAKRAQAAKNRQNNNPNLVSGQTRREPWKKIGMTQKQYYEYLAQFKK